MLTDFLNLPIEEVSAADAAMGMALCPAPSTHVFVTAPPMPDRPWLNKPPPGGLARSRMGPAAGACVWLCRSWLIVMRALICGGQVDCLVLVFYVFGGSGGHLQVARGPHARQQLALVELSMPHQEAHTSCTAG